MPGQRVIRFNADWRHRTNGRIICQPDQIDCGQTETPSCSELNTTVVRCSGGGGIRTRDLWVMSPTSCRCSTPRPGDGETVHAVWGGGRGARSGLASHGVAPAVLSGAALGHDRVRDGSGWSQYALGHGHHRPPAVRCMLGVCVTRTPGPRLPEGNGAFSPPRIGADAADPPSAMSTGRLRSVARRPPPASLPGRLPGAFLLSRRGDSSWERDSRLDAFSGSPIRT